MATFSKTQIIKVLTQKGLECPRDIGRFLTDLPSTGNAAADVYPYLRDKTHTTALEVALMLAGNEDEP